MVKRSSETNTLGGAELAITIEARCGALIHIKLANRQVGPCKVPKYLVLERVQLYTVRDDSLESPDTDDHSLPCRAARSIGGLGRLSSRSAAAWCSTIPDVWRLGLGLVASIPA